MEDRKKFLQLYHSLAQKCNEMRKLLKDRNAPAALINEVREVKIFVQKFLAQLDEVDSIYSRKVNR